jgi:hypothetical protein
VGGGKEDLGENLLGRGRGKGRGKGRVFLWSPEVSLLWEPEFRSLVPKERGFVFWREI